MQSSEGVEAAQSATLANASAPAPFCGNPKSDIILHTSDHVHFYVHKVVLSLVSPAFDGMFSLPNMDSQEMYDGRPCIQVSEDSTSLYDFFAWCDPRATTLSTTLESLKNALQVADKYSCDSVIKRIESFMESNADLWKDAPLVLFSLSIRFRFESLAPIAARMCLKIPVSMWPAIPEMEHISGLALHSLMSYHYRVAEAAASAATDFSWIEREDSPGGYFAEPCGSDKECRTVGSGANRWLEWFPDYMKSVADRLQLTPVSELAQNVDLLVPIHSKISASKCIHCHRAAHAVLVEFAEMLAQEIEKRKADVPFTIKY